MEVGAGRLVERFYHEVWNEADETVARQILHADLREPPRAVKVIRPRHVTLRSAKRSAIELKIDNDCPDNAEAHSYSAGGSIRDLTFESKWGGRPPLLPSRLRDRIGGAALLFNERSP